jgi:hypothetical protein
MKLTLEATLNKLTSPDAPRRNRPRLPARGKLILSAVMTVALLVALPGAAAAQASSPTSAQYDTTNDQIAAGGGGGGPSELSEPSGGDPVISGLPFTGVDLVLLGIVALALLSAGIAIQRLSRTAGSDQRI